VRALAFLPIAVSAALVLVVVASCDTGGEPPGGDEAGDAPINETSVDTHQARDSREEMSHAESSDDDGGCGTSGNACCTGETAPCGKGLTCKDKVCDPPCGNPGQMCCGMPGTCNSASSVCSKNYCTECGGSGQACCALNVCGSGGCCVGDICSPEGTMCAETDGGVCMAGGCGTCGSPGQPCCAKGCTAPETVCQGAVDAGPPVEGGSSGSGGGSSGECAGCGGPGQPCCTGSSCQGALTCTTDICICASDSGVCTDGG
jgi:hypothetical protein